MNDSPDVSVVMSVYNGADHLRETMDSILAQEEVAFELILVNDGSTDQSGKILALYRGRSIVRNLPDSASYLALAHLNRGDTHHISHSGRRKGAHLSKGGVYAHES
jgi:cellulose synthase/poly-beta-1,6-N-acetylglucosamine synthase-like glycosyltransferase